MRRIGGTIAIIGLYVATWLNTACADTEIGPVAEIGRRIDDTMRCNAVVDGDVSWG